MIWSKSAYAGCCLISHPVRKSLTSDRYKVYKQNGMNPQLYVILKDNLNYKSYKPCATSACVFTLHTYVHFT